MLSPPGRGVSPLERPGQYRHQGVKNSILEYSLFRAATTAITPTSLLCGPAAACCLAPYAGAQPSTMGYGPCPVVLTAAPPPVLRLAGGGNGETGVGERVAIVTCLCDVS